MARRSGLGKGLGALIPQDVQREGDSTQLQQLPLGSLRANPHQPRRHFDEETLAGLAASVTELGVLQPVLVRPVGDTDGVPTYELIAGERRWRAAKRAGLATIPAIVRPVSDLASMEQAVVENLHRADLNPLEEAAAYQQLLEDFGLTHDLLAKRVGRSRAAISNALRLFQLPPTIQRMVQEGDLTAGHARALLGTPDRDFQEALAQHAVSEALSVRAVEEAIRAHERNEDHSQPEAERLRPAKERPSSPGDRPVGLVELEQLLSDHLETSVDVEMNARRGRIVIAFADLNDLERLYRTMTGG